MSNSRAGIQKNEDRNRQNQVSLNDSLILSIRLSIFQ